jgi:hypothetical protein
VVDEHARRRGAVALRDPGEAAGGLAEDLELAPREALIALLGGGEVREQALHADPGELPRALGQRDERLGGEPVPVEAGLELEVQRDGRAPRPGGLRERLDQIHRAHRRPEPERGDASRVGGLRVPEHEERRVDPRPAELLALVDAHDREAARAGREGGAPDRDGAVAVGVRLHDGVEARGGGATGEQADVRGEGVEVDLGPDRAAPPL